MKINKFYAVKVGRKCRVIVDNWAECRQLVEGFQKAIYRSFKIKADAELYLSGVSLEKIRDNANTQQRQDCIRRL